eukprot:10200254-Lingulodinium_polyedra.AAC.1
MPLVNTASASTVRGDVANAGRAAFPPAVQAAADMLHGAFEFLPRYEEESHPYLKTLISPTADFDRR